MMLLAAIDWHQFLFVLFALVACVFALAVLFSANVVRMAFYLVISLGATAGLFFLAGAEFVGAMQLMIYVGGTLVLLVFGVMLTARDSFVSMKTRGGEWVLAVIVGGTMLAMLLYTAFQIPAWSTPNKDYQGVTIADSKSATPIGLAVTGARVDKVDQPNAVLRGGMSGYLLPFEIVSVHLLVVLIGAGYLARTKRRAAGPLPVAAPHGPRSRSASIALLLLATAGLNLLLAGVCFFLRPQILDLLKEYGESLEPNALLIVGCLFVIKALSLAAVYAWQRWGLYAYGLAAIAQVVVLAISGLSLLAAGVIAVAITLVVATVYGAVCSGGERSICSQME